ncbi:MAG: Chemotaxis CheY-like receiver protein [Ignavibacteria bacterium]|nr:MAG: Chemotaxis CheY-like receiver protein [Ignavibacteria bacterium]KAF0160161.1 MAG: Chemotaxis CheY-like receiver protein [Ignavibacteria bacterium]
MRVLIIEDDTFLQDFYRLFFKKINSEVIIREDGNDVINEIISARIDLIIMDINLRNTYLHGKRVDGIQFSRYIKTNYPSSGIPILLITAYPIITIGENKFEESLADDYLIKPITDYNLLVDKINRLVFTRYER